MVRRDAYCRQGCQLIHLGYVNGCLSRESHARAWRALGDVAAAPAGASARAVSPARHIYAR